ncbi:ULP-PROTEASE domain-containing protein [Mycena venus]|uniref:ULP-PROTEASE domain-containing protein n=1 Tax=Mycena venus TaxID=2733690 RepID=A0A8H7CE91_9AGAR|nr:ULP-PROTEASE domain-containing protein [Mycena venus]
MPLPPTGKMRSARYNQRVTRTGPGAHFTSPLKPRDKRKNGRVIGLGHDSKPRERVQTRLPSRVPSYLDEDADMAEWIDEEAPSPTPLPPPPSPPPPTLTERTVNTALRLCKAWNLLLPRLEEPFAEYQRSTHAQRPSCIPTSIRHDCTASCGEAVEASVQCLYILHLEQVQVNTCSCMPVAVLLVQHGVFPASPTKPRTGVSIDLLEFYRALFERSCDAITALAAALRTIYDRRGYRVLLRRNPGLRAVDPFREALSNAVTWSSNLQDRLRTRVDAALAAAEDALFGAISAPAPMTVDGHATEAATPTPAMPTPTPVTPTPTPATPGDPRSGSHDAPPSTSPAIDAISTNTRSRLAPPTLEEWGRPLEEGGDVVLGADGCFSYRHLRSAGDGPISYDPTYFVPKEKVHKQQYIVALLEEVNDHLPPQATVVQAYDVGCVTDHSLNLFPILSVGFRERVSFIINAMHAYGHQWVCQLIYNPRLRRGVGLTDGEGVERFWSRIRKLIPLTRSQWLSRQIWMIDQYAAFVNDEGRESLGTWITRQQNKNLAKKQDAALKTLRECRVPVPELRQQWEAQKAAQTSLRSHAPAHLRRELDKVMGLQTQIDAVEKAISEAKQSITTAGASPDSLGLLRGLEATHERLSNQAEALYASLNIHTSFPELRDLPLEFVRTLVMMRDLKINIRKRAVGSFYEWEALDRAVGGRREALGTKLHQSTRKAITNRKPALLKSIQKYNVYCAQLERLRPPGCLIPIPSSLPVTLNGLRDDPTFYEDVWITPSSGSIPRWLDDIDVRDGIRSLHAIDRCAEEAARLNQERQNLCLWLDKELAIVGKAMETLTDLPLQQRQSNLQYLRLSWAPALRLQPEPSAQGDVDFGPGANPGPHAAGANRVVHAAGTSVQGDVILIPGANPGLHAAGRQPTNRVAHAAGGAGPVAHADAPASRAGITRVVDAADAPAAYAGTAASTVSAATIIMEEEAEEGLFAEHEGNVSPEELDPGTLSDADETLLIHDILSDADINDEEEESAGVDAVAMQFEIKWECPTRLSIDNTLIQDMHRRNASLTVYQTRHSRVVVALDGRPNHPIEAEDVDHIISPTGRLNSFGMNGLAASFQSIFGHPNAPTAAVANRCAVLSTYDLHRYWEKPIWLVPIHRRAEEHWVLAVVSIKDETIFFFDSLAQRQGWRRDLRDVMILITRMVVLANRHRFPLHVTTQEDPWIARPLFTMGQPRQSNGHDCGLWVLCMIASILRGHETVGVSEAQMGYIRRMFTDHILTLPYN